MLYDSGGDDLHVRSGASALEEDEEWVFGQGIATCPNNGIGFKSPKDRVTGRSQKLKCLCDMEVLDPATTSMVFDENGHPYEKRHGIIECLTPLKLTRDPDVYVDKIDFDSFPPDEELAYLFDEFFSQYDREVVMLVGSWRRGIGFYYHIPEQEGNGSGVEWKADDDEMGKFLEKAKWIGTIHVHPGNSASPSQTDVNDWAKPENSGLHLVFGRDGSYTINGAIAGRTFTVAEGSIESVDRVIVGVATSKGRPIEELLKKKIWVSPVKIVTSKSREPMRVPQDLPGGELDEAYVETCLGEMGVAPLTKGDISNQLHFVQVGGRYYILTLSQMADLNLWCAGVCGVPKSKRLKIRPGKDGW